MNIVFDYNKNTFTLNTNKQYISVNEVNEIINKWFNQNRDYPNRTGDDEMDVYVCPKCGHYLISLEEYSEIKPNFCSNCGKALNWKDVYKFGKIVETQII